MIKAIGVVFDRLLDHLFAFVGFVQIIVMVLVSVAICSRYFFNYSLGWASEVSGYSLILLAYLGAPGLLRDGGHIKVDLIPNMLGKKANAVLSLLGSALGIAIFSSLSVAGARITYDMYAKGHKTDTFLRLPRSLLIGVTALGVILFAVQFFRNFIAAFKVLVGAEEIPSKKEATVD